MKIEFNRYQEVFKNVLEGEKVLKSQLCSIGYKYEEAVDKMYNKMEKTLSCMAGKDGVLYTDFEVAQANTEYFKRCLKEFRMECAA